MRQIELVGDAHEALVAMGKITGRSQPEVVSDALNTYLYILWQQGRGCKVVFADAEVEGELELEDLVQDKEAALAYFAELGW